jgi:hypothetical protein
VKRARPTGERKIGKNWNEVVKVNPRHRLEIYVDELRNPTKYLRWNALDSDRDTN